MVLQLTITINKVPSCLYFIVILKKQYEIILISFFFNLN